MVRVALFLLGFYLACVSFLLLVFFWLFELDCIMYEKEYGGFFFFQPRFEYEACGNRRGGKRDDLTSAIHF